MAILTLMGAGRFIWKVSLIGAAETYEEKNERVNKNRKEKKKFLILRVFLLFFLPDFLLFGYFLNSIFFPLNEIYHTVFDILKKHEI